MNWLKEFKYKRKAVGFYKKLKKEYGLVKYYLDFKTPFQLLVGTILSAQCTDERANLVLQELFKKYKEPKDFANMRIDKLEREIKSAGFYKNKAKAIKGSAKLLVEKYHGKVPDKMEELLKFPGVARKTANVILQNAFGKFFGIVVDTHVIRLSYRLGWTLEKDSKKIEKDLMELFPKKEWEHLPHVLKAHGRKVCKAPVPICTECILKKDCPKKGVILLK
ncbi:endonuclease III [Candidatus Woesearchaeota archaeon CG10_big_fil_rev_8_21_14_0_10_34_8]|jgi:endonuclease-3|nr:MAG: endonuclease III [Candidatus Woesearchaeota archaeon CG10_big_fil_rev_8_21_14_0_10_34_8]